jgi:hypothetical protein
MVDETGEMLTVVVKIAAVVDTVEEVVLVVVIGICVEVEINKTLDTNNLWLHCFSFSNICFENVENEFIFFASSFPKLGADFLYFNVK